MQFVLPAAPDQPDLFQERYSCSIDQYEREITRNENTTRGILRFSKSAKAEKRESNIESNENKNVKSPLQHVNVNYLKSYY